MLSVSKTMVPPIRMSKPRKGCKLCWVWRGRWVTQMAHAEV